MTGARRFSVSTPDWGQGHLSLDAIVAYVDGELAPGAHARADAHVAACPECAAEVAAQRQARAALRAAGGPCLPSSLLRSLRAIPVDAELPPVPPGLAVSADGQFVLLRDVPDAAHPAPVPSRRDAPRRLSRRAARIGAVSGLALGALAVGALTVPGPEAPPAQGVVGGAVLNSPGLKPPGLNSPELNSPGLNAPVQARLDPGAAPGAVPTVAPSTAPTAGPAVIDVGLRQRLERLPAAFRPDGSP
jgi:anti-sigma factor RsiW